MGALTDKINNGSAPPPTSTLYCPFFSVSFRIIGVFFLYYYIHTCSLDSLFGQFVFLGRKRYQFQGASQDAFILSSGRTKLAFFFGRIVRRQHHNYSHGTRKPGHTTHTHTHSERERAWQRAVGSTRTTARSHGASRHRKHSLDPQVNMNLTWAYNSFFSDTELGRGKRMLLDRETLFISHGNDSFICQLRELGRAMGIIFGKKGKLGKHN